MHDVTEGAFQTRLKGK